MKTKNSSNKMLPPTVADPGFPRGGCANSPGGAPAHNLAKFSQKLHEIERIWTPGGHASKILLCRSATAPLSIVEPRPLMNL